MNLSKPVLVAILVIPFLIALTLIYFLMPKQPGQKSIQSLKIPLKCPVEKDFCQNLKTEGLGIVYSKIASNSAIFAAIDGKYSSDVAGKKTKPENVLFTILNEKQGVKITYEFTPRVYDSGTGSTQVTPGARIGRIAKGDLLILAQDPKTGASFKLNPAQLN